MWSLVPAVAKKFKLMWGKLLCNPLAGIGPRKPSGDSGFTFGSSGYRESGLANGHQWTRQSHLEAYPTVFAGTPGGVAFHGVWT